MSNGLHNQLINLLNKLKCPKKYTTSLKNIIVRSTLKNKDIGKQINNIVEEFNQGIVTIMTKKMAYGQLLEPNQFRLVSLNRKPELVPYSEVPLRKKIFLNPKKKVEEIGIFNYSDLCFGAYGHYVVNIPSGKLGLGKLSNDNPIILASGPHVIHDPNFKPLTEDDLVDLHSDYIVNGKYHIIKIKEGYYAKIWIRGKPYFLTPRSTPYAFNDSTFVWDGEFNKLKNLWITHGNYSILRVPKGKIAKGWINDTQPILLEFKEEPYLFTDGLFKPDLKLIKDGNSRNSYFEDEINQVIIHGSIKRVLVKTGQVAITYKNGQIITYGVNDNPVIISDQNHIFDSFLSTEIQIINIPYDGNHIEFELNGILLGVSLVITYLIENPQIILTYLDKNNIEQYIIAQVISKAEGIMYNYNLDDFFKPETNSLEYIANMIKDELSKDYNNLGLRLDKIHILSPKILDSKISNKMLEFVFTKIQNMSEEQKKTSCIINSARANKASTDIELETMIQKAKTEAEAKKIVINASEEQAKLYEKHPGLLQYELAKLQSDAMNKISSMVIPSSNTMDIIHNNMPKMFYKSN